MSTERKLSALLHELQHARSPLAQARVLARAWRTVRELSPTDRRLLARHAGFEGAEDILEGLSRRRGGLAPAMLLRVLANARSTDGSAVSELLATLRDPGRRGEAFSLGADLAANLLAEPSPEDTAAPDIAEAIEELHAVEEATIETPEEALAALNALEPVPEEDVGESPAPESASVSSPETDGTPEAESETMVPQETEPPQPPPPAVVDWSRWQIAADESRPAPTPRRELRPSVSLGGPPRFEARAVMGAMGAEQSIFSQLLVLRRELSGIAGSSVDTLRELIQVFPDGWVRRRALCALLEAGIPAETWGALELVSGLSHEVDRRWCLGLLARRGDLRGRLLSRALDLVDSGYAKRRLTAIAR